jgi:hypothetical protein
LKAKKKRQRLTTKSQVQTAKGDAQAQDVGSTVASNAGESEKDSEGESEVENNDRGGGDGGVKKTSEVSDVVIYRASALIYVNIGP